MRPFSVVRGRSPAKDRETDELIRLLRQAADGDTVAFGRFYDRTAHQVYGVVLAVLRDPAQAEEVTQEVFVELWRLAPRYEPGRGSPAAWAATVARRRAVDRVRSEQAARVRDDRDSRRVSPDSTAVDSVAETVVDRIDHERVGKALAELSAPQREAITLAYYGGHTSRRIAELLNVPEGTIKTRIRDGLTRLRRLMEVSYDR